MAAELSIMSQFPKPARVFRPARKYTNQDRHHPKKYHRTRPHNMFNRLKSCGFFIALVFGLLVSVSPARAIGGLSPAAEEGVETAVELAIDALNEAASEGRGGSGTSVMVSFLIDSDELICNTWIIA
ncbi:MAG: hypothetical protein O7A66_05160, partial [Alphaproteobacteria bacterium]|nr:hypothetical protein [Alphaproteobacteria bacterium]